MTKPLLFTSELKAELVREALLGERTIEEIAFKHNIDSSQLRAWKKQAIDEIGIVFSNDTDVVQSHRANERIHDFAEVSSECFWETDEEDRFTYFSGSNKAFSDIPNDSKIGKTRVEILQQFGGAHDDTLPPEILEIAAKVKARQPITDCGYLLTGKTGQQHDVSISGKPYYDANGDFAGYRGIVRDLTDRLTTEKAFIEFRNMYQNLVDMSPDAVVLQTSENGRIAFVNQAARQLIGVDDGADLIGADFVDFVHPDYRDNARARNHEVLYGGEAQLLTPDLFIRNDGSSLHVERSATSCFFEGKPALISLIRDISERHKAEQEILKLNETLEDRVQQRTMALSESEALNRQILFTAGEGICGLNTQGLATFVNPAACNMLGYREDEILGQTMHALINHSYPNGAEYPRSKSPMYATFTNGEVHTVNDEVLWHKDGRPIPVQFTSTPIYRDDKLDGAVVTFNDISKTKKRELELKRSNMDLQEFAYAASHDLQEPLRKIQSFSERLEDMYKEELGDKGQAYINRIVTSATRMRQLIDDLLNYSQITTKAKPFQSIDFSNLLNEVLDDMETTIDDAGAKIEVGDLPYIEADPSQIRQLLQNLISNSIKFRRKDETLYVKINNSVQKNSYNSEFSNGQCEIIISDNGIGFDSKFKDRIFGIFERLHGRSEYSGTGIGLATCKKIVERHGGSIEANSPPEGGAEFLIKLPMRQKIDYSK